ncbi:MAG: O-antigen ligase family protein [Acidobacteria bacterium]|nr:O-antigen ligase family protein [Acidobacteriota bacterium]MCA1639736.1 O-antigen ligase family protein [Acidobacteriota bacterium]
MSELIIFMLCVILVFSVLAFGAVNTWALSILSFFAGLILIFWLTDAWLKKEFRFSTNALQVPLLGLILLGFIQLLPLRSSSVGGDLLSVAAANLLSLAPSLTRFVLIQLFVCFVFFAAALTFINDQKRLRKIVLTVIIFGSLMAFYGILQQLANVEEIYGLFPVKGAYAFASFVNRHHFAGFMEMTIGITLGLLFGKDTKKDKQLLLIIATVVMGMAIVFTGSRGAMLGLLGVLGFIIAANLLKKQTNEETSTGEKTKNYSRNFALIGGGLTLILILFGSVLLLGGDSSLLRGIGLQNPDDVSNGRTHFWQIALKIFFDHPILGAGLDSFGVAFTRYDTWNGIYRVEQAHNDYLQILADGGIAGFTCVAAFIFLLFKKGFKTVSNATDSFQRNVAIGAMAGCFGILIHSFFDFPLRTTSNAFFFLTLAAVATVPITSNRLSRKRK